MTRQAVRGMKRAIHAGARAGANDSNVTIGRESALSLLSRSIGFGHGRLAIIRLCMAVHTGATVPAEQWHYCHRAAHASKDASLQALYLSAARQAGGRVPDLTAVQ